MAGFGAGGGRCTRRSIGQTDRVSE
jgi:hypothetical protein